MTVKKAIEMLAGVKPHAFPDEAVAKWLAEVDQKLFIECIRTHEGGITEMPQTYDPTDDADTELLIQAPYDDIYLHYCAAMIDYWNGDFGRYNNTILVFNRRYNEYVNYYNRTNLSKQPKNYGI